MADIYMNQRSPKRQRRKLSMTASSPDVGRAAKSPSPPFKKAKRHKKKRRSKNLERNLVDQGREMSAEARDSAEETVVPLDGTFPVEATHPDPLAELVSKDSKLFIITNSN